MTVINITDERKPLGYYTWVALLRDRSELFEFGTDESGNDAPQVSFDRVAERDDVAHVHLIPYMKDRSHIRIDLQPGERVAKKWIRTIKMLADDPSVQHELPVIDAFVLLSDKPVHHFAFPDGSILITTNPEP